MRNLLRNNKGVTLIEILAVIVILGVVAAVAVPTIGNLIEDRREKAALSEWTSLQEGASLFVLDDDVDNDNNGEFSLEELINSGYLENFNSEISVHVSASRRVIIIDDYSSITFNAVTGEISMDYDAITINGFLVEGSFPPVRPDNRI